MAGIRRWHAVGSRSIRVSISVEDWDELADARRRRDERRAAEQPPSEAPPVERYRPPAPRPDAATPVAPPRAASTVERYRPPAPHPDPAQAGAPRAVPAPAPVVDFHLDAEPEPAQEAEPETTLGVAQFADDRYGSTEENLRAPAGIAIANLLVWAVGRVGGVVELIGVAFFVSVGLLLAAYVLREWQRDRTALICLGGAMPLPFTIAGLFL
jgi:hypothetical protein